MYYLCRISGYPVLEEETLTDAVRSSYLYGEFNLGGGVKRHILGFPYVEHAATSAATEDGSEPNAEDEKVSVGMKICVLPGLIDIPKLKDSFISSTLVLELHREDVYKRAFHARNVEEYIEMTGGDRKNEPPPDVNAGKKGGKAAAAPPPKKGAPAVDPNTIVKTEATEMTPADRFLLGCIHRALTASRQIRPHGTVRYRLEQLLSSSNDLLNRFARMRHGGQPVDGDETVVVQVCARLTAICFNCVHIF